MPDRNGIIEEQPIEQPIDELDVNDPLNNQGGVPSIHNANFIQGLEVTVMNTEGGKRLSIKNDDGVVGLYSVNENGDSDIVVDENGTMPRVEELSAKLDESIQQTNDSISSINSNIADINSNIEDINSEISDLDARITVLETP